MIAAVTSILDHSAGDAAALMQVAGVTKRYGQQRAQWSAVNDDCVR